MFRTLGISKMYLNFNKQLISIRESDRVELSDFVLYLPCSLQYFAGCNLKKSKLQSSDYFYFRPGSDACRAWYKVCCTCIFIRVLFPFIDQGWFLLNVIKSFHFVTKMGCTWYSTFDVDYIIIEAPSLRLSVGSLYFHYVANYFVVCISLCGEFSG